MMTAEKLAYVDGETEPLLPAGKTSPPSLLCSVRYLISIMAFLGLTCAYMNRVNLSVAITAMANSSYSTTHDVSNDSGAELCPVRSINGHNDTEQTQEGEFPWDARTQESILAAFYYGFPLLQIPSGIVADLYPGMCPWVICLAFLVSAVCNICNPVAAYHSVGLLIMLRVIGGVCESGTYPCLYSLMTRWAPPSERSTLVAIVFTGSSVGQILAQPISGILSESDFLGGWPSTFYLFGCLTIIWFIPWTFTVYGTPYLHPFISEKEKEYIVSELHLKKEQRPKKYPWKRFVTSPPLFAVAIADFATMWILFSFTSNLPIFLKEALGFDIAESGYLSAVPFVVLALFTIIGGVLADALVTRTSYSRTAVRKFMTTIGLVPSGAFLVVAGYTGCDAGVVLTFLTLGLACSGLAYSGSSLTMMEFAAPYAGMVVAVANSLGTLAGFTAPLVVGAFTENQADLRGWRLFYWLTFAIMIFAWAFFMLFGTSEIQEWAKLPDDDDDHNNDPTITDQAKTKPSTIVAKIESSFIKEDYFNIEERS